MIRILEDLYKLNESDEVDNQTFTPGSNDEIDYEQSQLNTDTSISKAEEIALNRESIENAQYNIKFANNQYILNNNGKPRVFNLVGIRGFVNTNVQHDNSNILNNMIIVNGDKEYTISQFNDMLVQFGILELNK